MDGNGRWALARGLPRVAGHRAGVEAVSRVVERARDRRRDSDAVRVLVRQLGVRGKRWRR